MTDVAGRQAVTLAAVDLTCIAGGAPSEPADAFGEWGADGDALWPAWRGMADFEMHVYHELGEEVGQKLLVLWAISRFRDSQAAPGALRELVDESGRPRFGDPLVEDMMLAAFALGAAWGTERSAPAPAAEERSLRLAKGKGELHKRGA